MNENKQEARRSERSWYFEFQKNLELEKCHFSVISTHATQNFQSSIPVNRSRHEQ